MIDFNIGTSQSWFEDMKKAKQVRSLGIIEPDDWFENLESYDFDDVTCELDMK